MYLNLNEATFSHRLMEELQEDIMQGEKQRRRFYMFGCGGQPYIRILKHIVGYVTHFKELAGHHGGMNFL